jgi:RNA polymerase nonessential primary-like sigma factor
MERPPTDEELATKTGLQVKHVREVRTAARTVASLDKPVGSDTDTSFGDMVAQDDTNLEESVVVALGEDALHRAIATLPDRERFVITARYGLDEEEPRSLEMIGRGWASPASASVRSSGRRSTGSRSIEIAAFSPAA